MFISNTSTLTIADDTCSQATEDRPIDSRFQQFPQAILL